VKIARAVFTVSRILMLANTESADDAERLLALLLLVGEDNRDIGNTGINDYWQ